MGIDRYIKISEDFLTNRSKNPEINTHRVPINYTQLPLGGIQVVRTAIMMIDIVKSKRTANLMGDEKFTEWVGLALHLFFSINDNEGSIDKYTGDGAFVTFSKGTEVEKCRNTIQSALEISQIVDQILNPKFISLKYKSLKLRIGIDYEDVRVERIGQNAHPQLIIVGQKANLVKELESYGKHLHPIQNTTICVGEDFLSTLPANDKKLENGSNGYKQATSFAYASEITGKSPYLGYEFVGRSL